MNSKRVTRKQYRNNALLKPNRMIQVDLDRARITQFNARAPPDTFPLGYLPLNSVKYGLEISTKKQINKPQTSTGHDEIFIRFFPFAFIKILWFGAVRSA